MLIKFTYVDAITGVSMLDAPCANGPVLPAVPGVAIDFSNESEWPCAAPIFYGRCAVGSDPTTTGVIDVLTQEVFDAARTVEMGRRAAQDVKTVADKEAQLWTAADAYSTGQISGVAIGILTIGVMQQLPKALAISAWSKSLWDEYYLRKAEITATSVLDLDFSMFGEMPYTVPELSAEVGM